MTEATRKVGCLDRLESDVTTEGGERTAKPESHLCIIPAQPASGSRVEMPEASFESEMPEGLGLMATCFWYVSRPGRLRMSFCQGLVESEASDADLALARDGLSESMERLERLGGGTFGDVHKVRFGGKDYALKEAKDIGAAKFSQMMELIVLKRIMEGEEDEDSSDDEENVHGKDFVVKMLACDDTQESLPYVMELAEESLRQVIQYDASTRSCMGDVMRYVIEMTQGLEYIHGVGVAHNDLKPDNVLLVRGVDGLLHAKVADLGCVRALGAKREALIGTVGFIPLECLGKEGPATTESDVFAAGVIAILAVLRRDLRNHSISFCPTVTTEAENAVITDLLANGNGFGSEEMAAVEMQVTRRTLGDKSVQEKMLVPGNLHEEVPASVAEWVCSAFAGPISLEPSERSSLAEFREDLLALYGLFLASRTTADAGSTGPAVDEHLICEGGSITASPAAAFSSVTPPARLVEDTSPFFCSAVGSDAPASPALPPCAGTDPDRESEATSAWEEVAADRPFRLEREAGDTEVHEAVARPRRPHSGLSITLPAATLSDAPDKDGTGSVLFPEVEITEGRVLDTKEHAIHDPGKLSDCPFVSAKIQASGLSHDSTVAERPAVPSPRRPPPDLDDATAPPQAPHGLLIDLYPAVQAVGSGDGISASLLYGKEDGVQRMLPEELVVTDGPGTSPKNVVDSSTKMKSRALSRSGTVARCPAALPQPLAPPGVDSTAASWKAPTWLSITVPPVVPAERLGNDTIDASFVRVADVWRGTTLDKAMNVTGKSGTSSMKAADLSVSTNVCGSPRGGILAAYSAAFPKQRSPPGLRTAVPTILPSEDFIGGVTRVVSHVKARKEEHGGSRGDMHAIGRQATPSSTLDSTAGMAVCKLSCDGLAAELSGMNPPQRRPSIPPKIACEAPVQEARVGAMQPSRASENRQHAVGTTILVSNLGNGIHKYPADSPRPAFSTAGVTVTDMVVHGQSLLLQDQFTHTRLVDLSLVGTVSAIISGDGSPPGHSSSELEEMHHEKMTQSTEDSAAVWQAVATDSPPSAMIRLDDRSKGQAIKSTLRISHGPSLDEPPAMNGGHSTNNHSGSVLLQAASVVQQATTDGDVALIDTRQSHACSPVLNFGEVSARRAGNDRDKLVTVSRGPQKGSSSACQLPNGGMAGHASRTRHLQQSTTRRLVPVSVLLRTTKASRQVVPTHVVSGGAIGREPSTQHLLAYPSSESRTTDNNGLRTVRPSQNVIAKHGAGSGVGARRAGCELPPRRRQPPTRATFEDDPAAENASTLRFVPLQVRLKARYPAGVGVSVRREPAVRYSRRKLRRAVGRAGVTAGVQRLYQGPMDPQPASGVNAVSKETSLDSIRGIASGYNGVDADGCNHPQAWELEAAFSGWYCRPMIVHDVSCEGGTTAASGSLAPWAKRSGFTASAEHEASDNASCLVSEPSATEIGAEQAVELPHAGSRRYEGRVVSHVHQPEPPSIVLATGGGDMVEMISCTELESREEKRHDRVSYALVPPVPGGGPRGRLCAGDPRGKERSSQHKRRCKVFRSSVTRNAARQAEARLKDLLGIGIHPGRGATCV